MNIDISDLDKAISDTLDVYSTEVLNAVNSTTDAVAKELKEAISSSAPVGTTRSKRGHGKFQSLIKGKEGCMVHGL